LFDPMECEHCGHSEFFLSMQTHEWRWKIGVSQMIDSNCEMVRGVWIWCCDMVQEACIWSSMWCQSRIASTYQSMSVSCCLLSRPRPVSTSRIQWTSPLVPAL